MFRDKINYIYIHKNELICTNRNNAKIRWKNPIKLLLLHLSPGNTIPHISCIRSVANVRQVLWITNAKVEKVTRFLFRFEMYASNPQPACNSNLSEHQQAKLQKIKELTSILQVKKRLKVIL